jgi:hypothetical protein
VVVGVLGILGYYVIPGRRFAFTLLLVAFLLLVVASLVAA